MQSIQAKPVKIFHFMEYKLQLCLNCILIEFHQKPIMCLGKINIFEEPFQVDNNRSANSSCKVIFAKLTGQTYIQHVLEKGDQMFDHIYLLHLLDDIVCDVLYASPNE